MPLGANTTFDVRTTGSDIACGGCFDPGQTAGMLTDGAATSATGASPVFTSASYNFVVGDIGAWLFISSGTNWTPGWYQIASVATNAATLSAAIGAGYLMVNKNSVGVTTAAGCATTASPTLATWTIDYSQQNAAQFSYTDLASVGAGLLVSSVAFPFGKQHVGNGLIISSGTNFTAGVYVIASVAAAVATVVGAANITAGAGTSGVGGQGGAFATPGKAASVKIAGNDIFWKSGTYNLTGNVVNTAGCQVSDTTGGVDATNPTWWVGWNTVRTLYNSDTTMPTLNANAQSTLTLFSMTGSYMRARNIIVDGNGATTAAVTGFNQNANYQRIDHIKAQNCEVIGIDLQGGNNVSGWFLAATGCSGTVAIRTGATTVTKCYYSSAWNNTTHGFQGSNSCTFIGCISSGNTGGSTDGFNSTSIGYDAINCVSYGNGRSGFDASNSIGNQLFMNCIAEANLGAGWSTGSVRGLVSLVNCAGYNNTSGNYTATNLLDSLNFVINTTGTFFVDAINGNFALNNTVQQGALARAAGFPGLMPRGTTTGYQDIGAVHHQDAGGAAGMLFRTGGG